MKSIYHIASRFSHYKKEIEVYRKNFAGSIIGRQPTLHDCIWSYIRYGCVLNHYLYGKFYSLHYDERKKSFTYRWWNRFVPKANDSGKIHYLKNKVDFNTFFADYIHRDWLYSNKMTLEEFKAFVNKHAVAIIKPMDGLEGVGITLKEFTSKDYLDSLFLEYRSHNYLIEEKISQHPDMIFGNKSVNTIRVYTIYDETKGQVVIIKTVVRAGIGDSIVDNSHAGGCAYEVDVETGVIVSASYRADGLETDIHPGTDIKMPGRTIPFWSEVKELCFDAAERLRECRFIGWDVAVTEKGPLLIEGNHTPDLDMVEFVGSHGYLPQIKKALNF